MPGENPFIVAYTRAHKPCLYHTNAPFNWSGLKHDLQEMILERTVANRVVEVLHHKACFPDELRLPNIQVDWNKDPWPEMMKNFVFKLTKQSILDMTGGPLTVTFNEHVDRSWFNSAKFDFARWTEEGFLLDRDVVCRAMDFEQTWSGVTKIRLRQTPGYSIYHFELVRRGEDGRDEILSTDGRFGIYGSSRQSGHGLKEILDRRFKQELASLKPDKSEGCSLVSGGRTIRLCLLRLSDDLPTPL